MKHYIYGEKSLSKKEKSLLKFHGVISPEKQRVVVVEDGEVFFDGDQSNQNTVDNSSKALKTQISDTNASNKISKQSLRPGSAKSDKSKKQADPKDNKACRSLESLNGGKRKELRFQMDEHLTVPGGSNSQLNSLDQNRNEYVRIMEQG